MQKHLVSRLIKFLGFTVACLVSANIWADSAVSTSAQLYFPSVNTVAGNPNGKVSIVEFFDYNCGYCHEVPAILSRITEQNSDVRIVYRDYPILGPSSLVAARAAVAAAEQGKYDSLHNALFASNSSLDESNILRIASSLGINVDKLNNDVNTHAVSAQLHANAADAAELGLNGVPVVVVAPTPAKGQRSVNGYILVAPTYGELQQAVNAASNNA